MPIQTAVLVAIFAVAAAPQRPDSYYYAYSTGQDRKYEFAVISANGNVHSWGSWNTGESKRMGGSNVDRIIVKKRDGSMYVITDKATFQSATKILEPVMQLGKQQGDLGRQQGALGQKQGSLGRQQGELGRQQGKLAQEMARIARESDSDNKRRDIERKMQDLSAKMQDLGKQQEALGGQQRALGEKQQVLGKKQEEASQKADVAITQLLDSAFDKGLAKPIR